MRTWLRIATVAGVALAWAGLWLAWERWTGLSDSDTTTGFEPARGGRRSATR